MSKQGVSNTLMWSCQTLDSTAFMWLYILCFCVFLSFRQGMVWGWMVPGSMCRVCIIVLCYFSTKCRVCIVVLCYFSTKCRVCIIVLCYFSTKCRVCIIVLCYFSTKCRVCIIVLCYFSTKCRVCIIVLCYFSTKCRVYIIVLCYFSTKCRVYIIVLCYFSTKCREYIIVPCYFSTKCLFVLQFLSSQTSPWQRCAQTTTLCAGTETAAFPLTRPVMGGLTARMPVMRASTTAVSPALWSRGKGRNTKATFKCYYALHSSGGLFSSVVIKALCLTTSTLQR